MQNITGHWLASLRHYSLLCLLLSSPERLPYNPYALAMTIVAYFGLGMFFVDESYSYAVIAPRILLDLAMTAAIVRIGLAVKDFPNRFPQTFSALVGISLIVTLVAIPLQKLVFADAEEGSTLAMVVYVLLITWYLAAISRVFRRAFEISITLSAMISFSYYIANLTIEALFLR